MLKGVVVKRKSNEMESSAKRPHLEEPSEKGAKSAEGGLQCVGILPGLGNYDASSDSESSCSSEEIEAPQKKYDLLGRELVYQEKGEKGKEQR